MTTSRTQPPEPAPMRLLIATDGSPAAAVGVDLVNRISWPQGTAIGVVQAVAAGIDLVGPWPAVALAEAEQLETHALEAAQASLEEARAALERVGREVSTRVLRGRPSTAVAEAAEAASIQLIVVGSRGHGAIETMLLGSVSSEIVDHAPRSVLVARQPTVRRVLLAVDGSEGSRVAAEQVRTWPLFTGSTVHVVSVAPLRIPWWSGFPPMASAALVPLFVESAERSRRAHLETAVALADELRASGLEATAESSEGVPAAEILRVAARLDADLIVLGTHGWTGLRRILLGSVARNVLHHATASVLVARQPPSPS